MRDSRDEDATPGVVHRIDGDRAFVFWGLPPGSWSWSTWVPLSVLVRA